jgi:hypothetical protein
VGGSLVGAHIFPSFLFFKGQSLLVVAPVMEAFVTTADNALLVLKSNNDRPFELVKG